MRTGVDTGRLGRGISYPGIDPRLWISLAVITAKGTDPKSGVYVDVSLLPSGDRETCRVGSGYVGNGYGSWFPLEVDDLVVVLFLRGDPAEGPVVLARLWSGSDKPPVELGAFDGAEPPSEPVIVVGPGQTVRVVCREGASVTVTAASGQIALDSLDVRLGGANPTEPALLGNVLINNLLAGATVPTAFGPSGPLIPAPGAPAPWVTAKSTKVKVG